METKSEHYQKLLGLPKTWEVEKVHMSIENKCVNIHVKYIGDTGVCPDCKSNCIIYDHQPSRIWRHLDTMQFRTYIHSSVPRVKCIEHGIHTMQAPWANKHSRFTLMFEAFAIDVIKSCRSQKDAATLLNINWHQVHNIMKTAVETGLERRNSEEIPWLGMDEKSFRKGHKYISLLNDIENGKVIEVAEGRTSAVADKLIDDGLTEYQQEMVCGVSIDMSLPYIKAIKKHFKHADIVFDKFHIAKHLNDAVDKVRRKENAIITKENDKNLIGTKYLWLKGLEHLSDEATAEIERLVKAEYNVADAWRIKELFRSFWTRRDKRFAELFFERWYNEARALGIKEITKVAKMLKKHLNNILTYFDSYITNAVSEGLNSRIQAIKSNAKGYRNFENYRISILFFCGKLDMHPQ